MDKFITLKEYDFQPKIFCEYLKHIIFNYFNFNILTDFNNTPYINSYGQTCNLKMITFFKNETNSSFFTISILYENDILSNIKFFVEISQKFDSIILAKIYKFFRKIISKYIPIYFYTYGLNNLIIIEKFNILTNLFKFNCNYYRSSFSSNNIYIQNIIYNWKDFKSII